MFRFLIDTVLTALVLSFILPIFPGVEFHGRFFPEAIIDAVCLALIAYAIKFALGLFSLATMGCGILLIIMLFWLIPAVELKLLAAVFPSHLTIGWWGAILGGLTLLVVNALTGSLRQKQKK